MKNSIDFFLFPFLTNLWFDEFTGFCGFNCDIVVHNTKTGEKLEGKIDCFTKAVANSETLSLCGCRFVTRCETSLIDRNVHVYIA